MKLYWKICFLIFITLLPSLALGATPESAESDLQSISANVLSPYCPGRLLQDCPSGAATELKEKIRERLLAGESREQIVESLYSEFGEELRSTPPMKNFGLLAWLGPLIFFALGLIVLFVFVRKPNNR
jgi:cytochrome c-type biogenesis protein CcmH